MPRLSAFPQSKWSNKPLGKDTLLSGKNDDNRCLETLTLHTSLTIFRGNLQSRIVGDCVAPCMPHPILSGEWVAESGPARQVVLLRGSARVYQQSSGPAPRGLVLLCGSGPHHVYRFESKPYEAASIHACTNVWPPGMGKICRGM